MNMKYSGLSTDMKQLLEVCLVTNIPQMDGLGIAVTLSGLTTLGVTSKDLTGELAAVIHNVVVNNVDNMSRVELDSSL